MTKLTMLMVPIPGVGPVNAFIGLAEVLVSRGHKVVFAIEKPFEGKLSPLGFVEEIFDVQPNNQNQISPAKAANIMLESGVLSGISSYEKLKIMTTFPFWADMIDKFRTNESQLQAIIAKHKPDVFAVDGVACSPTLMHSGKPWVYVLSPNPLMITDDDNLPPAMSGYAVNGDRSEWQVFRQLFGNLFAEQCERYDKWTQEIGCPPSGANKRVIQDSPYLNIYQYPEELDYTDVRPIPNKWFRIDSYMRKGEQEFKIPDKFLDRDVNKSKLIYLSLGSMGSVDVNLMERLIAILAKSSHKFIISKGMRGDTYQLPDNMWGENSVPQTRVLPLVDLVITHGGNNSVTETFSCGKPMIVMPLWTDQFDNAQRVEEKGFGLRLDPYNCTEKQLLDSIETLLNDKQLKDKLSVAYKRIQKSNCIQKAMDLIEDLVK